MKIGVCSILFQVYWFALVWSAGRPVSLPISAACVALSIGQIYVLGKPFKLGIKYLLAGVLTGIAMDTALTYWGVFTPSRCFLPWPIAPVWLIGLWAAFVAYTRTGLDGMRRRYVLQAVAGGVCGPLAWIGGSKLGAGEVNPNLLAGYGVLALCWALVCLFLFKLSDTLQVNDE